VAAALAAVAAAQPAVKAKRDAVVALLSLRCQGYARGGCAAARGALKSAYVDKGELGGWG